MPARRYFIGTLPVAHINGKIAPVALRCGDTDDPEHAVKVSYFYGYRRRSSPNVSRFGIREHRRDLTTHPYTAQEDENRTLFRASLAAVYEHKNIAAHWALCLADYRQQSNYATPLGYAIAAVRANGGQWLEEWTA